MSQTQTASPAPERTSVSSTPSALTLYGKCFALARNLWWTWHHDVINLFHDLDPIRWRQLDHNPIALLAEFTPERLDMRAGEMVLFSRINHAYRRLREYTGRTQTWATTHAGVLGAKPVAYFSAEFGIHESVPIYSGGLGVLSGDHIKSASGLGMPLVAVGLRPSTCDWSVRGRVNLPIVLAWPRIWPSMAFASSSLVAPGARLSWLSSA